MSRVAGQTTGYVKARGSVGLVDLHPFVGDPVTGGLILADGGAPGMPVQLNGYDKGKTSFDGKLLIPDAIPGAPQRIAIDTARLPLDLIPSDTDKSVVVRRGGAAIAGFDAQTASTSAIVLVTIDGKPAVVVLGGQTGLAEMVDMERVCMVAVVVGATGVAPLVEQ